jgi:hypothetical protein
MKRLFVILLIALCSSCMVQKTFKFSTGELRYSMEVPLGYKLSKTTDDHGYIENRLLYPDSSIIYITNDDKSGGAVNAIKVKEYGQGIYLKILSSDTLDISGNEAGKYWREQKVNKVVVGYINVLPDKKEQYDKALATLRKKD